MPHYNNSGEVSNNLSRGWAERQKKALGRVDDGADWRSIDAERQAYYKELADKARAEAEERKTVQNLRVCCPVCDGNAAISVDMAERVIRALEVLPANSTPDQLRLAILSGIATGIPHNEPLTLHPTLGLHQPRKAENAMAASAPPASPPCLPAVMDGTTEEADAIAEIRAAEAKTRKK